MMQAVDVLSRTAGHVGNVVLRARQRAPASVQWATTAGAAALVLHGLRRVLAASRTRSALDSFRHARVLVTGAATTEGHGLGPDVCRELSRIGCTVVLADGSDTPLGTLAAECRALGAASAVAVRCDLASQRGCEELFARVEQEVGSVDCVVLLHGTAWSQQLMELSHAELAAAARWTLETGFQPSLAVVRHALAAWQEGGQLPPPRSWPLAAAAVGMRSSPRLPRLARAVPLAHLSAPRGRALALASERATDAFLRAVRVETGVATTTLAHPKLPRAQVHQSSDDSGVGGDDADSGGGRGGLWRGLLSMVGGASGTSSSTRVQCATSLVHALARGDDWAFASGGGLVACAIGPWLPLLDAACPRLAEWATGGAPPGPAPADAAVSH